MHRPRHVALVLAFALAAIIPVECGNKHAWFTKPTTPQQAQKTAALYKNALKNPAVTLAWYQDYKATFGRKAKTDVQGLNSFRANMAQVAQLNSDPQANYFTTLNKFADLDFETFSMKYLMKAPVQHSSGGPSTPRPAFRPSHGLERRLMATDTLDNLATGRKLLQSSVDWRTSGYVTPVRDQGQCGSCWAFAATATIESAYLMTVAGSSASTLNLSEQQLVSCVNSATGYPYTQGCNGGGSDDAINYVIGVNQTTEARYPYSSGSGGSTGSCNQGLVATVAGQAVELSGSVTYVPVNNEAALMSQVAKQPVVIYMDVESSFQLYSSGIYTGGNCSTDPNKVNHAMVVVGYQYTGSSSTSYWIVRNSWSSQWGESGYVRVAFGGSSNPNGVCGMYTYPLAPSLKFVKTLNDVVSPSPSPAYPSPSPSPPPSPSPSPSPPPSLSPPPSPYPSSPSPEPWWWSPEPRPSPRSPHPRPPHPSPQPWNWWANNAQNVLPFNQGSPSSSPAPFVNPWDLNAQASLNAQAGFNSQAWFNQYPSPSSSPSPSPSPSPYAQNPWGFNSQGGFNIQGGFKTQGGFNTQGSTNFQAGGRGGGAASANPWVK